MQQQVSTSQNETEKNSIYDEIIELSKTAIDKIDQNDLLRYFGMKHHETDENKKFIFKFLFDICYTILINLKSKT